MALTSQSHGRWTLLVTLVETMNIHFPRKHCYWYLPPDPTYYQKYDTCDDELSLVKKDLSFFKKN